MNSDRRADETVHHAPVQSSRAAGSTPARLLALVLLIGLVLAIGHYGFAPVLVRTPVAGAEGGSPALGVPAPPRATLVGRIGRPPQSVALTYESLDSAEAMAQFYRLEMARRRWTPAVVPADVSQAEGPLLAYSNRAGVYCYISISSTPADGSRITIVRAVPAGVPLRPGG